MTGSYKKLYRSKENRAVAGVIGGIGEYFSIDPTLLRLIWFVLLILSGIIPGLVVYVIAFFIMPEKPDVMVHESRKCHGHEVHMSMNIVPKKEYWSNFVGVRL